MARGVDTDVVVPCRADLARMRLTTALGDTVIDRRVRGRTSMSMLHSAPHGPLHRAYPTFDATVAVTAIDDTSCLLTVSWEYDPPFGPLGEALDRTVMHGVAESVAIDFAARLGHALAQDSEEGLP